MTPESLMARHCAPTLAAMKSASLICLAGTAFSLDSLLDRLQAKGVGFRFFTNCHGCRLLFVYRQELLFPILSSVRVALYLKGLGYRTESIDASLEMLGQRLLEDDFPHEIGFFLGYPEEDVFSFIEHEGRGYKESLMWKSYHNVEDAQRLCKAYRQCTACMLSALEEGHRLESLVVSA